LYSHQYLGKKEGNMTGENLSTRQPGNHSLAIVSLVLSVLGLVAVLPLVGSIGGLVTGTIARREIRANPELYTGAGMAQAGIILGWIGIALVAVALLGLCLFLTVLMPVSVSTSGIGPEVIITVVPVVP
jgi:hypothetical protein